MVVARVEGGQLRLVDRLRESVQLAAGLDAELYLDEAAEARALSCLQRFGARLRGVPAQAVRVVGTNTLRRARNSAAFLQRAEAALGLPIAVISGIEEARLIYLGVAHSLAHSGRRRLVIDIGGGSTELIIGEGVSPLRLESLHMGCVSLEQGHFPGGKVRAGEWDRAVLAAHQELELVAEPLRALGWQQAVGASGTAKAIAGVLRNAGWADEGITREGLERLRTQLLRDGGAEPLRAHGLNADRVEVFPSGAAIMSAAFEALGIDQMDVADGALREGLLYDLLGRIGPDDVREHSVDELARRYHVDPAQAARVAATAELARAQVEQSWELEGPECRRMLAWAARLHEIGLDIAHSQYHKHGAYVLRNADLAGFSRQEQALLAALVRVHRRKFAPSEFKDLPERMQTPARRLALLLRLAVLLHRPRLDQQVEFVLSVRADEIELGFAPGWLDEHPLLRADLEQEAAYLANAGYRFGYA